MWASALAFALLAACGGDGASAPKVEPVASIALSQEAATMRVGSTLTVTATVKDAAGSVLSGRTVWLSSDTLIARVDKNGVVTAVAPGWARIIATADTKQLTVVINVIANVASIAVAAPSAMIATVGTVQLVATPRDANGEALPNREIAWTSSDPSIASVSSTGLVAGARPGTVTITAQSEGKAGTVTLVVVQMEAPAIADVAPLTIRANTTYTITGAHFGANPSEVTVTAAGAQGIVLSVEPTKLTVRFGSIPCQANGLAPLAVRTIAGVATVQRTVQVATARTIAVGQALFLSDAADLLCNQLPAGSRFLVNVVNATTVTGNTVPVQVRGVSGAGASATSFAVSAPAPAPALRTSFAPSMSGARAPWTTSLGTASQSASAARRDHMQMLEESRALVARLGQPSAVRRARLARLGGRGTSARVAPSASGAIAGATPSAAAAPVPLTVGAMTTMRYRASNSCATSTSLTARVVYVGTRSVVLEATDAPLANQMDEDYRALGAEFDNVMYDVLKQNFGDPLVLDSETDNNGRVIMLFTKGINDRGANLLGYVQACDFFAPTEDPSVAGSNQAEIFYARVPTGATSGLDSRAGWMRSMRSTLIHEAKHIASIGHRIANFTTGTTLEEAWLEEGTAQVASELYGRAIYPTPGAFRNNASYRNTLYCELRPSDATCKGMPTAAIDMFAFLRNYYQGVESKSFFSSPQADVDIYGSAWLFARWAADQYATDEAAFFRSLMQQTTASGLSNLAARTGRSISELQTNFLLALYADDFPGATYPAGARYTIPSWNTRDVWAGLNTDIASYFTSAFPLPVRAFGFGNFATPMANLLGGAAMFVEVSGTQSMPQLIEVTAGNGVAITDGSPVRLAILRVQ